MFLRIVKQQLAFLKTVENKLKGALGNSKSLSGRGGNFNTVADFDKSVEQVPTCQ